MRDLSRLLRARSIAVLGGVWAEEVIRQCQKIGFKGSIWPVHPRRRRMGGLPCVRRLADLSAAPDAVFVGVNRQASVAVVAELAALGAGGAVCFASGYAETGNSALQKRLIEAAGALPLLGPNCYGMVNYLDGVALWPDQHGGSRVKRGAAIIGQSSNILINLSSQRRGLPVSYLIAAGNQAQCGLADIAGNLLCDRRVSAIGFYLESVGNAADFAAMAAQAAEKNVPLVVLAAGKTERAQRATASHTAAMTTDSELLSAFLQRCGVAEVTAPGEFIETLKLLHTHGPLPGNRVVSLSCSGGEAALTADLAAKNGLRFSAFSRRQKMLLKQALGSRVHIANPLDYHTYIWYDAPALKKTFTAATSGRHDCAFLLLDFPHAERCSRAAWETPLAAFIAAKGKRCAVIATLPENMPEDVAASLLAKGVAPLSGLEDALSAMRAAASINDKPDCLRGWRPLAAAAAADDRAAPMDEVRAKALLAGGGIAVPRGGRVTNVKQAAALLRTLAIKQAAVKTVGLAHKTEAGGVRLNISARTVAAAVTAMPAGDILIEEMIENPVAELLVNVRRNRAFGAVLTVGIGGTQAEVLADTRTLILPATAAAVRRALAGLRLAPLLTGWRGAAAANLPAAARCAVAAARLLLWNPDIMEIEINPLILTAAGTAVAADALITTRKAL